jgi:GNAT superfamily N-acetyltransferase
VWAVTCLLVRTGFRRRGISRALAAAAVDHARRQGARALEAYPMVLPPGHEVLPVELHVGTHAAFAEAGLAEVGRPTKRRAVMRIELQTG